MRRGGLIYRWRRRNAPERKSIEQRVLGCSGGTAPAIGVERSECIEARSRPTSLMMCSSSVADEWRGLAYWAASELVRASAAAGGAL
jgi:hypothetical protein